MSTPLEEVDVDSPDPQLLDRAALALSGEEVILYPSDTVYGLLCSAESSKAVDRLRLIKGCTGPRPFVLIVDGTDMARKLAGRTPPMAAVLMDRHWPGPLTIILRADPETCPPWITGEDGSVAVRFPDDEIGPRLVSMVGGPLVSTSANKTGDPPPLSCDGVASDIVDMCALAMDGGPSVHTQPSTVIRLTTGAIEIVRQGPLNIQI